MLLITIKTCPACGKPEEPRRQFVGAFCTDCFAERNELYEFRNPIDISYCTKCEKIKIAGEWVNLTEDRVAAHLASRLKSKYECEMLECESEQTRKTLDTNLVVRFTLSDGGEIEKKIRVEIPLDKTVCPECSKRSSGYYEAIIQLRGDDKKKIEDTANTIGRMVSNESFVAKIEMLKEGVDLYIGSANQARHTIEKLGLRYNHSTKLVGMKAGKKLLRRSYCVRL